MAVATEVGRLAMSLALQKSTAFWWMFGESLGTLKPGRRVEALVKYVGQSEARCILPEICEMDAILSAKDISTNSSVIPGDYLKAGQSVAARYDGLMQGCSKSERVLQFSA